MRSHPETQHAQRLFSDFVLGRDTVGMNTSFPERLPHYRRLVFNVFFDSLSRAFPIAKSMLGDALWQELIEDYMRNHDSSSPQVWKMPLEFFEFICEKGYADTLNKPWLNDLLYFEWIEIEVHTMPDITIPNCRPDGDILKDRLVLNPEHRLIHLRYPVHRINCEKNDILQGDYFLIVYRHPEDLNVRFLEVSAMLAVVLEMLRAEPLSLEEIIYHLKDLTAQQATEISKMKLIKFMKIMHQEIIMMGYA